MSKEGLGNMAHSVHQRLLNEARRTGRPFDELLQYFAMERFLYRLSCSEHRNSFVLKGAVLFAAWEAPRYRSTRDIDFLAHHSNSPESIAEVFRDICRQEAEPDGLTFDADQLRAEPIIEEAAYAGVRVSIHGRLGNARVGFHADIAFSDVVLPRASDLEYPTILGFPAPRLRAYTRESVVAEKLETMVRRGEANSRMKDFYDVWYLARHFDFDGSTLLEAVVKTFSARGTPIQDKPLALTPAFARAENKQQQWATFVRRGGVSDAPESLAQTVGEIAAFLAPVAEAASTGERFASQWTAPGPWVSA